MLPQIGQNVVVTVACIKYDYSGRRRNDVESIEGMVVPNFKWLKDDYICVLVKGRDFTSQIPIKNIVSVNGSVSTKTPVSEARSGVYEVKSLKSNKVYVVTRNGSNIACDCVGFQFRHDCKHAQFIRRICDV